MEEVIHKSSGGASGDTTSSRSMSKDVSDLVDTYIALAKANVTEKAASAASFSVASLIIAVFALLFVFFVGFALAWWMGQLISSVAGGFLMVAGLFGLVGALLIAFKEQLIYPVIRNRVVKKLYE